VIISDRLVCVRTEVSGVGLGASGRRWRVLAAGSPPMRDRVR